MSEQNEVKYKEAAKLFKSCLGTDTKRAFAKKTNLNSAVISRACNGHYIPSMKNLRIFAENAPDKKTAAAILALAVNPLAPIVGAAIGVTVATVADGIAKSNDNPAVDHAESSFGESGADEFEGQNEISDETVLSVLSNSIENKDDIKIKTLSWGIVASAISSNGLVFQVKKPIFDESFPQGNPDYTIKVNEHNISDWWFYYVGGENSKFSLSCRGPQILLKCFSMESDEKRQITFVTDDSDTYNSFLKLKKSNSYKGNITVILVDGNNVNIVRESIIARYDDATELITIL